MVLFGENGPFSGIRKAELWRTIEVYSRLVISAGLNRDLMVSKLAYSLQVRMVHLVH